MAIARTIGLPHFASGYQSQGNIPVSRPLSTRTSTSDRAFPSQQESRPDEKKQLSHDTSMHKFHDWIPAMIPR